MPELPNISTPRKSPCRLPEPVAHQLQLGTLRQVTQRGIGWALLSLRDDAEVERLRRWVNAKEGDRALHTSAATVEAQIGTVCRKGYAFSHHTLQPGFGMIARPLPHLIGGRWCAIGAAGDLQILDARKPVIVAELHAIMRDLDMSPRS